MLEGYGPDEDLPEELSLLGTFNSIHDRTQLQSKFDFELTGDESTAYEVDVYFFFPQNMGVNADTYPLTAFYADLTHLLRVRTPELADGPDRIPAITAADQYFAARLNVYKRRTLQELVIHDTKMFGCLLYTELKRFLSDLSQELRHSTPDLTWARRNSERLEGIHRELRDYREQYVQAVQTDPVPIPEVRRAFLLVNEYLSYRLEEVLIRLHNLLLPHALACADLLNQIEALMMGEQAYREENLGVGGLGLQARGEAHYYRLGLLKKYVSEVLFLRSERVKRDHVYRNFIGAFGAALAAFFAALANLQTAHVIRSDDHWRVALVVFLGVVAYVFKDRIKDVTKEYFYNRLKVWLPDFDVKLYFRHFAADGRPAEVCLGSSQECTRYLTRSSLPEEILYLRDLGHQAEFEPERNETYIHYNKRISVTPLGQLHEHLAQATVRRIRDVLRFDVARFLTKLDNPEKKLNYFDGHGVASVEAPKVYHLNLIFRYTITRYRGETPVLRELEVERLRVVLNKTGIVRIEQVISRGELGFQERLA